jgi:hypothetical protein
MSALSIRRDRTPAVLRKLAKGESDACITRRILAISVGRYGSPNAGRLGHPLQ